MSLPLLLLVIGGGVAAVASAGRSSTAPNSHPATRAPARGGAAGGAAASPTAVMQTPSYLGTSPLVASGDAGAPYRLVDAVAMSQQVISWVRANGDPNDSWVADALDAGMRAFLQAPLSSREKMRALMLGVVLPVLANDFAREEDGYKSFANADQFANDFERRKLLQFLARPDDQGGTALQRAQLSGAVSWVAMWFAGPEAMVLRPEFRPADAAGFARMTPPSYRAPSADAFYNAAAHAWWRDSAWQPASLTDRAQALDELFWRLMDWLVEFCEILPGSFEIDPHPCSQLDTARGFIQGIRNDESIMAYYGPEALAAGNLRRVQLCSQAPFLVYASHSFPTVPSWVSAVVNVALSVVKVVSLGLASGAADAARAAISPVLGLSTEVVTAALAVAKAATLGGNVASIVASAWNTSLVQALRNDYLLLPGGANGIAGAQQLVNTYAPAAAAAGGFGDALHQATAFLKGQ